MKNITKNLFGAFTVFMLTMNIIAPVAVAAALGERTMAKGTTGSDVSQLQGSLKKLGYFNGKEDGVYGVETEAAVKNLEKDKGLTDDGIADVQLQGNLPQAEKSSAPADYKQEVDIVATAYASGPHDNGKWGSLTQIGTQVRPGIIAVDPKVIPLRSRVYIEFPDGHSVYATAEDTGGAIKGNRIDIAMSSVSEAYDFGIQNVKVYVLN